MSSSHNGTCIWCSGKEFVPVFEKPDYQFILRHSKSEAELYNQALRVGCCLNCGITTQIDLPSTKLLELIYSEFYSSYPSETIPEESNERSLSFLDSLPKDFLKGKALEIGSYNGRFLNLLKKNGMDVVGCDPNETAAKAAEENFGIKTIPTFFTPGIFDSETFDLVISRLLLEHIMDPASFFVGINNALKTGGHIALEVPNCQDLMENGSIFWMVEHITYFTSNSLFRILKAAGFRDIEISAQVNGFFWITAEKEESINQYEIEIDSSANVDITLAQNFCEDFSQMILKSESYLDQARIEKKNIGIFGAGYFMGNLMGATSLQPTEIKAFFDNNPSKWGVQIADFDAKIVSPETIPTSDINFIIVATQNCQPIINQLKSFCDRGGEIMAFFPEPQLIASNVDKTI